MSNIGKQWAPCRSTHILEGSKARKLQKMIQWQMGLEKMPNISLWLVMSVSSWLSRFCGRAEGVTGHPKSQMRENNTGWKNIKNGIESMKSNYVDLAIILDDRLFLFPCSFIIRIWEYFVIFCYRWAIFHRGMIIKPVIGPAFLCLVYKAFPLWVFLSMADFLKNLAF